MDVNAITSLVSSIGFPIVACGALFWFQAKFLKELSQEIKTSLKEVTDSISENTKATTKLVTTVEILNKIGGDNTDG